MESCYLLSILCYRIISVIKNFFVCVNFYYRSFLLLISGYQFFCYRFLFPIFCLLCFLSIFFYHFLVFIFIIKYKFFCNRFFLLSIFFVIDFFLLSIFYNRFLIWLFSSNFVIDFCFHYFCYRYYVIDFYGIGSNYRCSVINIFLSKSFVRYQNSFVIEVFSATRIFFVLLSKCFVTVIYFNSLFPIFD